MALPYPVLPSPNTWQAVVVISKQVTTGSWTQSGLLCFSLGCRRGEEEETREKGKVGATDELAASTSTGTVASPTPPPKLWDNIKTQTLSVQVSISHPLHLPCQSHCRQAGRQAHLVNLDPSALS